MVFRIYVLSSEFAYFNFTLFFVSDSIGYLLGEP